MNKVGFLKRHVLRIGLTQELALYIEALNLYRAQNWHLADEKFSQLQRLYPDRYLYKMYANVLLILRSIHLVQAGTTHLPLSRNSGTAIGLRRLRFYAAWARVLRRSVLLSVRCEAVLGCGAQRVYFHFNGSFLDQFLRVIPTWQVCNQVLHRRWQ
jgi:hypothetical protein